MSFTRILVGFVAVTVFLGIWRALEHRFIGAPGPALPGLRAGMGALVSEAALLTLFAGLWFASLGAGGAPLLFLVLGLLMEVPASLRQRAVGGFPWKATMSGVLHIVLAGMLLGRVLG